ncbi:MAG: geranylgeranylglycerol-phosphate geranylgeranyltransferase [Thermoplasmatota archaeon]
MGGMSAYLAVLRPLNGSMAAAAVLIGSIVEPEQGLFHHTAVVIFLSISAFLVASGGNILNDLGDIEIDRKAHPRRPLPAGLIAVKDARVLLAVSWTAGVLLASTASLLLKAVLPVLIVLASIGLLVLYERSLKEKGAAGNICIGVLTGAPFLLGASAGSLSLMIGAIFLMASLSNISREIMKDAEDMEVDRGLRSTIAIKVGKRSATIIASAVMMLAIISSMAPLISIGADVLYIAGIAIADWVLLISAIRSWQDPGLGQRIAKLGMFAAMAVFSIWGLS